MSQIILLNNQIPFYPISPIIQIEPTQLPLACELTWEWHVGRQIATCNLLVGIDTVSDQPFPKSGSVGITDSILSGLCWIQEHGIFIQSFAELQDYLIACQQEVLDAFLFICDKLINLLKEKSQIIVEINHDPEIRNEYIMINVRKDEYEDDFFEKIDSSCNVYYNMLFNADGRIVITSDFLSPESS
jgi:hypothetical protein